MFYIVCCFADGCFAECNGHQNYIQQHSLTDTIKAKDKTLLRLWIFCKITCPQSHMWLESISAFIDRNKKKKHFLNIWLD